jgi:hypothetical protein
LLLKKFIREGGISKTYLGSKFFDPSLIEPIRKVVPQSKFNNYIDTLFEQTAPSFSPKATNERNINSQPGIARKTYHLPNNGSLDRKLKDGKVE